MFHHVDPRLKIFMYRVVVGTKKKVLEKVKYSHQFNCELYIMIINIHVTINKYNYVDHLYHMIKNENFLFNLFDNEK